jgi:hypothetical protein
MRGLALTPTVSSNVRWMETIDMLLEIRSYGFLCIKRPRVCYASGSALHLAGKGVQVAVDTAAGRGRNGLEKASRR